MGAAPNDATGRGGGKKRSKYEEERLCRPVQQPEIADHSGQHQAEAGQEGPVGQPEPGRVGRAGNFC
jgi:hypothetical protein